MTPLGPDTTSPETDPGPADGASGRSIAAPSIDALSVIWCPADPSRLGELLLVPPTIGRESNGESIFGRGTGEQGASYRRLLLARDRPGHLEVSAPLALDRLSRDQLAIRSDDGELSVRNIGRLSMFANGVRSTSARIVPGDIVQLGQQMALLFVRRRAWIPPIPQYATFAFAGADSDGIVGESPIAWEVRRQIAFVAARPGHVLVCGSTGTGKELVAQAIHRVSGRGHRPLVSRSAATFPESLIDAELFGNARNYPNVGMSERLGLIGQADGSTLFLDEIGELPLALQTRLLRVLDAGEYQRLGDSATRRADFRLVAATNSPEALRLDVASRFTFRIDLAPLTERREDIPLLARHLLGRAVAKRSNFSACADSLQPTAELICKLVQHRYSGNVRELDAMVWHCIEHASGQAIDWVQPARTDIAVPRQDGIPRRPTARVVVDPKKISAADVQNCLDRESGSLDRVWRELGLQSRFALYRHQEARSARQQGIGRPRARVSRGGYRQTENAAVGGVAPEPSGF